MSKTLAVFLSPLSASIAVLMVGVAAASVTMGVHANLLGDAVAASRFGAVASTLIEIYLFYVLMWLPLIWVLSGTFLAGVWFLKRKGVTIDLSLPEKGRMAWFALVLSIPVTAFTTSLPLGDATGLIALLTMTGLVLCAITSGLFFQLWRGPSASTRSTPIWGAGAAA